MSDSFLFGGFIQRVDVATVGAREVALLRVRVPGETANLLLVGGGDGRVALVEDDARDEVRAMLRGADSRPHEARLRAALEGAKLFSVGPKWVVALHDERAWVLEAAPRGALHLSEGSPESEGQARAALEEGAAALVARLRDAEIGAARERLVRAIRKAEERLEHRIAAVRADLARIATADALAARAQLFVAEASRAPRGATRLSTQDWTTGVPVEVELPLDPAKTAREQIDAMFKRARRLKEGARIGERRLADASAARQGLAEIRAEAALAYGPAAIASLLDRARKAAPKDFRASSGASKRERARAKEASGPRPPYRSFVGAGENRLLVGRGAEHNDALTFHVARPHDLWMHAKNRSGAHVIVPLAKGASCPADLLVDAAHLAAHFSEARDETLVEIEYTPRRYLRKPKGSAPGFVVVTREKVLVLREEPPRLERLLASEVDPAAKD